MEDQPVQFGRLGWGQQVVGFETEGHRISLKRLIARETDRPGRGHHGPLGQRQRERQPAPRLWSFPRSGEAAEA